MTTPRMASSIPTTKVMGGTIGAAAATILIWALENGFDITVEEGVRLAITTILTFVAGYMLPPAQRDQVVVGKAPRAAGGEAAE